MSNSLDDKSRFLDIAKRVYEFLCGEYMADDAISVQKQVWLVAWLEYASGCQFRNTDDFHYKMKRYLGMREADGTRLKNARLSKGWTQLSLARYLGVSQQFVWQMETGRSPLILKALEFIDKQRVLTHAEPDFAC